MSSYSLRHIFKECIDLREAHGNSNAKKAKSREALELMFQESWFGINRWIESRLGIRMGAEIPMLGHFSWEFKRVEGEIQSRPIFILNDSFVKDNRVKKQKSHKVPLLAPSAEINFSQISIKYTKQLTKDMVFCCCRDIIKKIGEYVSRGYECNIDFLFGTLKVKERVVKFEFDQGKLISLLPDNLSNLYTPSIPYFLNESDYVSKKSEEESPRFTNFGADIKGNPEGERKYNYVPSNPETESARSTPSTFNKNQLPTLQLTKNNNNNNNDNSDISDLTYPNFSENTSNNFEDNSNVFSNPYPELSPRTQELLLSLDEDKSYPNKQAFRANVREKVALQAYHRCLDDVNIVADSSEKIHQKDFEMLQQFKQEQIAKKEKADLDRQALRNTLDSQIKNYEKNTLEHKEFVKASKVNFLFPDAQTGPPGQVTKSYDDVAKEMRRDLLRQIRTNQQKKVYYENLKKAEESQYLDQLAMELDYQNASDRAEHLEKQRDLLEAWERDSHIRTLKKLQDKGKSAVNNYITHNLPDALPEARNSKNMSIGYDPRKGRQ